MKKNNKVNKIIILSIIGIILVVSLIIFILNYSKDSSSFSIIEKNWINNHQSNIIDVSVYNDVPIYGQNGEGIIFSYLEEFTNSYGINFNKVSYLLNDNNSLKDVSFRILSYNEKISDNDIELYRDSYVFVSKNNDGINSIDDLSDKTIVVLDRDVSDIRYFLGDINDIKVITCKDVTELLNNLSGNDIDYAVIPNNLYLDDILSNDLYIVYHLDEIYKRYVLTVNDKTLNSIMNKYTSIFKKDMEKELYKTHFLNTFFKYSDTSDVEKMNYNASNYTYGYVVNMPYENTVNKEFVGTFSNYLSNFEDLANIDFKIVEYKNVEELRKAFSQGEVDLVFGNFNTSNLNIDTFKTVSMFKEDYVVLSRDNYSVNSIRSLKGKKILTVTNTFMYDYLVKNGIEVVGYRNTDEFLRNIDLDSIVVMDNDTYEYYRDKKFKNYKVIYRGVLDEDYSFVVRDVNKNKTFYDLFNYYISSVNYKDIRYSYNTNNMVNSRNEISVLFRYIIVGLGSIVILGTSIYLIIRKKNKQKFLKKDDKLKFIDVMTSLKNRNYLNYNIASWENVSVYPQAIVIIDLNNIKYINDNYGHEEGDEVIKKAASILIANQEENTDIIRTDGNEFLIYMIGYSEKKVIEYTRIISKEMKSLPHEFGATLGYSMILNDVKTIDDAINEATLSMRQAKEKI